MAERIKAEIEAAAPVKAGGSYVLEFTKYNGGRLWIRQAAEADRVRGVFFKDPGATDILIYVERAMECSALQLRRSGRPSKTLLTVDLTEEYKALYPEAGITRAVRREYTSANARWDRGSKFTTGLKRFAFASAGFQCLVTTRTEQ